MNTVFLIGNGFDCNLDLATTYGEFYKWYLNLPKEKSKDSVANFINYVQKELEKDPDNCLWRDMELALGDYTKTFQSEDIVTEAIEMKTDLDDAISEFIETRQLVIESTAETFEKFKPYLYKPEAFGGLRVIDINSINKYKKTLRDSKAKHNINVITFNYSVSLERLLNFQKDLRLGAFRRTGHSGQSEITLQTIEHIHGFIEDRLILGVNDESQIANEKLHNTVAMNLFVKSKINSEYGAGHEIRCVNYIAQADLICIFGTSCGETDKQWWDLVMQRMESSNARLLFFERNSVIFGRNREPQKQIYFNKLKREFITRFFDQLTEDKIQDIIKRIYICHNSDTMFKL